MPKQLPWKPKKLPWKYGDGHASGRYSVHVYFTECKHFAVASNCQQYADPVGILAEYYFEHKVPSHCGCKDEKFNESEPSG